MTKVIDWDNLPKEDRKYRAIQITCGVCGLSWVVKSEKFWSYRVQMRTHVIQVHKKAKKDMFGKPIKRGYGWADLQVYVKELDAFVVEG